MSNTGYDAFRSVDQSVSKPVLGSDGAQRWQSFQSHTSILSKGVAPTAPLQKNDRLAHGTWHQEREVEAENRKQAGEAAIGTGYQNFAEKNEGPSKEERQIRARKRPDKAKYFFEAPTFEGWRWDYVFTTRDRGPGYYWDGMDSVKNLDGLLEKPANFTEGTVEVTKPNESDGRPKKKKRTKGPTIVQNPSHPLEQVAAALHRQSIPLPPGWEAAKSDDRTYYFHRASGKRSWEPPKLPDGWKTAQASGRTYFYHERTKETCWDWPSPDDGVASS